MLTGSSERTIVRLSNLQSSHMSVTTVSPEAFSATHAQCWCELGTAHGQASTSKSTSTTVHSHAVTSKTQLEFPWQDDESEPSFNHGQPVAFLPRNNTNATGPHEHEPELRLIISGYRWVASSNMGTFWHEASDLGDDKDAIASFALLDTLTRWLPHWQGRGTLHVRTNDVCVLRGIRGGAIAGVRAASYSPSGIWNVSRSLCGQYDLELSAKVVEHSSTSGILFAPRGRTQDGKCAAGALRNPDVVNAAVKWLMASGQQGSTVYRTMLSHLTV